MPDGGLVGEAGLHRASRARESRPWGEQEQLLAGELAVVAQHAVEVCRLTLRRYSLSSTRTECTLWLK